MICVKIPYIDSCWRPYHVECTGSLLTSEVKRHRAQLVLGWGTAWEALRVPLAFSKTTEFRGVSGALHLHGRALRRQQQLEPPQKRHADLAPRRRGRSSLALQRVSAVGVHLQKSKTKAQIFLRVYRSHFGSRYHVVTSYSRSLLLLPAPQATDRWHQRPAPLWRKLGP